MVSQNGELNAFEEMKSLICDKKVQCLNGCIAALGRFMSKSRETVLAFFQVLRAYKKFDWTLECE